jgi:cellulose synthase/poly-beta-1,6-N-acetylglucosamine synthase-like glycosyltransferase
MVLLTYNQESYIRAAIAGALSQDYANLEIVISDDSSTDGTFDIVREMAQAYKGRHHVIVNRTRRNMGLIPHFYEALALSRGALIVGAAGDDISYPKRVSTTAGCWLRTGADGISTKWDLISADGSPLGIEGGAGKSLVEVENYFPKGPRGRVWGVSSAYSREALTAIEQPKEVIAEDLYFTLLLKLRSRKIAYIDEATVAYRQNPTSSSNSAKDGLGVRAMEEMDQAYAVHCYKPLEQFEKVALTGQGVRADWGTTAEVDFAKLRKDILMFRYRSQWISATAWERLAALKHVTSPMQFKWAIVRVFGLSALEYIKRARDRVRPQRK